MEKAIGKEMPNPRIATRIGYWIICAGHHLAKNMIVNFTWLAAFSQAAQHQVNKDHYAGGGNGEP